MGEIRRDEYKNLRATILQRGTVRGITFLVTFIAWGALATVVVASAVHFLAPLLSLMVLAAGFETIFQLHLGVERVGRYLQVAYEERPDTTTKTDGAAPQSEPPGWETAAMAYGKAHPAAGSDALFTAMFLLATLLNLLLVLVVARVWVTARTLVLVGLILAHAAFLLRLALAKRRAGRQRAEDLARFRELLGRE